MLTVSKEGGEGFRTINEALAALESDPALPRLISIKNGVYRERLEVHLPGVSLIGEDRERTVITGALGALGKMPDGTKRGTFRSYTVLLDAPRITLERLTVENTAGDGRVAGQAIALYADADGLVIRDCSILGRQDTLFTGPLPPKEIQKGGFIGPKEFAPRVVGRQYYRDCFIEGDVDFIFGSAAALFENCEIHSLDRGEAVNGYATAASTPKGEDLGYVFYRSRFTGERGIGAGTVFLGRPWREWAKTALIECELGEHINPLGWHDWGKEAAHTRALYAEYGSTGAGADMSRRADWVKRFTKADAERCLELARQKFDFCPGCLTRDAGDKPE